jgi:hypothetical protein
MSCLCDVTDPGRRVEKLDFAMDGAGAQARMHPYEDRNEEGIVDPSRARVEDQLHR